MKSIKKPGIIRRPIEYVLMAVLAILIGLLAWMLWYTNNTYDGTAEREPVNQIEGTLDSVNTITEDDIKSEQAIDDETNVVEDNASSLDAAADNASGAYDESEF